MDRYIDRIKKTANEISEKRDELREQKKINVKNMSIADELFKMRLKDASSLQEIESVSEAVNYERRVMDTQTRDNQDRIDEISQEADDYIDDLENNVRVYKQMGKTSDLVNVRPRINEVESKKNVLKKILAGLGAVVTPVASTVAVTFQKDNMSEHSPEVPSAHHAVLDTQIKTPWDTVREIAKGINEVAEADAEERKRRNEIKEQSKTYPKPEQGEYREGE
jgi:hypothetical protein